MYNFIRPLHRDIESTARRFHVESIVNQGKETSTLVSTLRDILYHWGAPTTDDQRQDYLDELYDTQGDALIHACHQHLTRHHEGHRPAMVPLFSKKRSMLLDIIKRLPLTGDASCRSLVKYKQHILANDKKKKVISIDDDALDV